MTNPFTALDAAAQEHRFNTDRLEQLMDDLRRHHQTVIDQRLPAIRLATHAARQSRAVLAAEIEAARDQFDKPKTRVFHGFQVGYRGQSDEVEYPPEKNLVAAIRKHIPDQAETLIETKEMAIKPAVKKLPADIRKLLGVTATTRDDKLVLQAVDDSLSQQIQAMLGKVELDLDLDGDA